MKHLLIELLGRYTAVLRAAWQQRAELAGPARLADEAAFLPAALALAHTPVHPAPRRTALLLCALFTLALTWAVFGRIDIVAVAQGRIVVSQRSKLVQPLEAGVVTAIHVRDGQRVRQGQLLVELDATAARADANRVAQEREAALSEARRSAWLARALTGLATQPAPALRAGAQRSTADASTANWSPDERAQLRTEWSDITARLARLHSEAARRRAEARTVDEQLAKLEAMLPLARRRERDVRSLSEQGFMSGHAGQDRTRERVELERDLATTQARRQEAAAALRESEQTALQYRAQTLRELRERLTKAELAQRQLGEEAAKTQQRQQLAQLLAPVDGTVQQLTVHTAGGVVTPAQVLLVVVPHDADVTAEVVLENKDVGFVREGQAASVKLETFAYTRYGTIPATVSTIAADAVDDDKRGAIFPATLRLERASIDVDGKTVRLSPGMNLSAEIKTGQRRVIDYLLSPLQQHLGESLRER